MLEVPYIASIMVNLNAFKLRMKLVIKMSFVIASVPDVDVLKSNSKNQHCSRLLITKSNHKLN